MCGGIDDGYSKGQEPVYLGFDPAKPGSFKQVLTVVGGQTNFTWKRTYTLRKGRSEQICEFCGEKILYDESRFSRGGWAGAEYAHVECVTDPFMWDKDRAVSPYSWQYPTSCKIKH